MSVKSLGLSCVTAALDIHPYTCITLESAETYLAAKDPKLRSQAVMVRTTHCACTTSVKENHVRHCDVSWWAGQELQPKCVVNTSMNTVLASCLLYI